MREYPPTHPPSSEDLQIILVHLFKVSNLLVHLLLHHLGSIEELLPENGSNIHLSGHYLGKGLGKVCKKNIFSIFWQEWNSQIMEHSRRI